MTMDPDERNFEMQAAWAYARSYYQDERVIASFEPLARNNPGAFIGYMTLRKGIFEAPSGALSLKNKELVILAIECALRKTNPPPVYHAQRAVAAGATVDEIAEVVSICIMISGMLTYQESGRFVLEEAERYVNEHAAEPVKPGGVPSP
jgi:alkylhydroperoxidase/carboxymuconolactone decarboxylase family protein YurZ